MRKNEGVTLIELMVVLVVLAILIGLAAPGLRSLLVRWAADTAAASLVGDFRFARSEAIKRNDFVTICRSTDGKSCAGQTGSWHTGWVVFVDHDSDGVVDAAAASPVATLADDVLRVQQALSWVASVEPLSGNAQKQFKFRPTGLAPGYQGNMVLTVSTSVSGGTILLCVTSTGRVQQRPGQSACAS